MKDPYVDLHVHSYYSDGSMSPEEIAAMAVRNRVGVLAVSDHDVIEGSIELCNICKRYGIGYVSAVERDALESGIDYHVLAYGFDKSNAEFIGFIKQLRFLLDEMSVKLVKAMGKEYSCISLPDYMDFHDDRRLGGWKALRYLKSRGIISNLSEGVRYYAEYGVMYDKAGFPSIGTVCQRIRQAGGYAVLAHPGVQIDTSDPSRFSRELKRIIDLGLDGIECYYPLHSPEIIRACLDICAKQDLMVTVGSDCHGVFGKAEIGEMKVTLEQVEIKKLVKS